MHMRLEMVVLPVLRVDRAKAFYRSAGFREDLDYACGVAFRIVQFTPPGSEASIVFGEGLTSARPGSVQGLVLGVDDIDLAREHLLSHGVAVSEVFHDSGGVFYHLVPSYLEPGPDPAGRDRASFARFSDPDGNGWVIQEERRPIATRESTSDHHGRDTWSGRRMIEGVPNATRPAEGTSS